LKDGQDFFLLEAECLMLDANSQYRAKRSKEEKENTRLRLRVSAVIFFHAKSQRKNTSDDRP